MSVKYDNFLEIATPTEADARLAQEICVTLERLLESRAESPLILRVQANDGTETLLEERLSLPRHAVRLLNSIMARIAAGNAVASIPSDAALNVDEAADFLNVSHQHLGDLLDKNVIPSLDPGSDRRVLLKDLVEYKGGIDSQRLSALETLAAQAQQLDMGY